MTGEQRRQQLSDLLAHRGFADLSVLAETLRVSESTVRRDLSQLEEQGFVRRTHGGAVFVSERSAVPAYATREATAVEQKQAIGRVIADLIDDNETILLDGGTTTYQVASQLLNRPLQVVTNSLPIANLLSTANNIELIFIGGYIYPRTGVALGPQAQQMLESLNVSKVIFSAAGLTEDALYNVNLMITEMQQQMIRCADEVIVAADSSKFGKRSLSQIGGWEPIDLLVTDVGLSEQWRRILESKVKLILANGEKASQQSGRIS
jgi:DeoR family transcriptional regulator, fructose operon transcriptional repressor